MRRSGCWMRRRRLRPLLGPQLQLHRRHVQRPRLPHRQRPPHVSCSRGRCDANRSGRDPDLTRCGAGARAGSGGWSLHRPLAQAALNELNTACQNGDASACGKLLPVVEAECAQKIAAACGFAGFLYERGRGVAVNAAMAASFYQPVVRGRRQDGVHRLRAPAGARQRASSKNEAKAQATLRSSARRASWRPACSSRCSSRHHGRPPTWRVRGSS